MKYAMTLDGKIAAFTGRSKWITGEKARGHVQKLRHDLSGIMVGVGTVLADDPMLTCRLPDSKNPVRIICDTNLRTPLDCNIVRTADRVPTIFATCTDDKEKISRFEDKGCRILKVKRTDGHPDLPELMRKLGEEKIDSILLEGGGTLNWSALSSGVVNRVAAYISPKIFGGADAKSPVEGRGVMDPRLAFMLEGTEISRLGDDYLIQGRVRKGSAGRRMSGDVLC